MDELIRIGYPVEELIQEDTRWRSSPAKEARHEKKMREHKLNHTKELKRIMASWASSFSTRPEERDFVTLLNLTGESQLETWESQLRASLAPYKLFRYLAEDIAKPDDEDDEALSTWTTDRADIFRLITASSLKNPIIWSRMTRLGWNPEDVDPRETYKKVFDALRLGTAKTTRRTHTHTLARANRFEDGGVPVAGRSTTKPGRFGSSEDTTGCCHGS